MKRLILTFTLLLCIGVAFASAPSFPGGQEAMEKYLTQNIKYPARAMDNGIEGKVPLEFVVKADGTITSIKIKRMIDPDLEAEAIRLVKAMPAWEPAVEGGTPVDAVASIVINFRLPDE